MDFRGVAEAAERHLLERTGRYPPMLSEILCRTNPAWSDEGRRPDDTVVDLSTLVRAFTGTCAALALGGVAALVLWLKWLP